MFAELKNKFKNIIKRLLYIFGYSIRKVQKLPFSSTATTKQKVEFIKNDSYILDFKKVGLDGDIYFVPKYSNYIPIKRGILDKTLYGTLNEPMTHKFIANLFTHFKGSMVHAGAFCGDMLPSFSKSVNGFVYAFEPVLENFIMSKQSVMQNDLQNVFLFNAALGNEVKCLRINTGIGQNWHRAGGSAIDEIGNLCASLTVDNFTYSSLILIQLDVEGFELNALQGAENTIKQHHPIIALEDNKLNCSEFLTSHGYIFTLSIPGLDIWVHNERTNYLEKVKNIKF